MQGGRPIYPHTRMESSRSALDSSGVASVVRSVFRMTTNRVESGPARVVLAPSVRNKQAKMDQAVGLSGCYSNQLGDIPGLVGDLECEAERPVQLDELVGTEHADG